MLTGRLLLPACYSIISIIFVVLFNGIKKKKQKNMKSISGMVIHKNVNVCC